VKAALRRLGAPAHFKAIAEQVHDISSDTDLAEGSVYAALLRYEDTFVRLGEGFFSLVEWERHRAAEAEPVLPYCPAALPDPPNQPKAFLESVMVARDVLAAPRTVNEFLRALCDWASLPWPQPRWVCQGALSAYYLAGVIPYVFYVPGEARRLSLTLPPANLQGVREYCLDVLSRRLQAMSEFWWLLQRHQPVRVTEFAQIFVTAHPLGLDDVANRLALLVAIGAVQEASYGGRYRLTPLGDRLAVRWARQPMNLATVISSPTKGDEWDLAELSFD